MNKSQKKNDIIRIAIIGSVIVAIILTVGTFSLARSAGRDTEAAVRNVSLLYLSELTGRREQVVSSILDDYKNDMDIAIGLMEKEDLADKESLQKYQLRMKQLYDLEKFAFVDTNGLIYTSRGTRNDIDQYQFDYNELSEPRILIKHPESKDRKVVIAVPVDNLPFEGQTLVVCFMEMSMEHLLEDVSLQTNNSTTFCNIYTAQGDPLTDMVLGGLAGEANLLDAMERAEYEAGYSLEGIKQDFSEGRDGVVSFSYNGIRETLYYVPIHDTDWMLTYLIRESVITEQINSISDSIITRGLIQSIVTALVLAGMFALMIIQMRNSSRLELEHEVSEAENRVRQQELEEQIAMQEELLEQEKKRVEQDSMITALASDYRSVYYVDLDKDDAVCYRKETGIKTPFEVGQHFAYKRAFTEYADEYVADSYREGFLKFIEPDNVRSELGKESMISYRYLVIRDGNERYEMLRMAGVRNTFEEDDYLHAVGAGFSDIDSEMRSSMARSEELKEALQGAEQANRAKSEFVSNMSHEIRTPITAILGMNEMIRRECSDETILSYAENIKNAGVSLLGIISDILDFSKIEAGRMELVNSEYRLMDLVTDLYNLIRFRSEAKGLSLSFSIDPELPRGLIGDELRVKQIMVNLLTNAVKYTEKGSVILKIGCAEKENNRVKMYISVTDTGIGIRPEEMDKLFSAFDRLDASRNKTIEGTGLGLSITRRLLTMMDTDLQVESVYNEGSRFYFYLWQDISDPDEIGDVDPVGHTGIMERPDINAKSFIAPGKSILIVDDTPMNLQVVAGLLKRTQMKIETASSGEECVELFGRNSYDIIFLDYRMPGMDGIDTIKKMASEYPDKFAVTPVICLTASAVSGDREKLMAAGFTDYLSKPVNVEEMEETLRKNLSKGISLRAENDELSKLPPGLLNAKMIDVHKGLSYCGDAEDYLSAIETFYSSMEKKADALTSALEKEDTDTFTITVHSLKSTAGAIGAIEISDMAKALEQTGKEKDMETLRNDTKVFINAFNELREEISWIFNK